MIWGKTYKVKLVTRNWFAWRLVHLKNGQWAWLETIRRYWDVSYPEGGGWKYTALLEKS